MCSFVRRKHKKHEDHQRHNQTQNTRTTMTSHPRNLATGALKVSVPAAPAAQREEPAVADRVQQSPYVNIGAFGAVEPAVPYDRAQEFAPPSVAQHLHKEPLRLSVAALRGQSGSSFESYAAILRGAPRKNVLQKWLPVFYERDVCSFGETKKFCLIKGSNCFVFHEDTDLLPLYVILLDDIYPIQEDSNKPDKGSIIVSPMPGTNKPRQEMKTILLKYRKDGSQADQFTFDTSTDASLAKRFIDAVEMASKKGGPVTASVVRAERMGVKGHKEHPTI